MTRRLSWCVVMVLALGAGAVYAQDLLKIVPVVRNDHVVVSFNVAQAYNDEVRDAIASGLRTTFTYDVQLRMVVPTWVDRTVATTVVSVTDRYDNLTRRHSLSRTVNGRIVDAIVTEDEAVARTWLSSVERLPLVETARLDANRDYYVRVSATARPSSGSFLGRTQPAHRAGQIHLHPLNPDAWTVVLAAALAAGRVADQGRQVSFAVDEDGRLVEVTNRTDAVVTWQPGTGWLLDLPASDVRAPLIELYLPVCSAIKTRPITVGHLGQSLDGFIATHAGESQYVTGEENIVHLHRMRALSDAVVVGAGTVAADDPLLTTRHVSGPSPLRVVLDPTRRLADHYRLFNDEWGMTLYVCARSQVRVGETHFGRAQLVAVEDSDSGIDVAAVLRLLRQRGCSRVFVEGGGVTVSAFLDANLLDRLHVAIAPLIIGNGRPAIRLPPRTALSDCHRPRYRVFRMGGDVLFDCEIRTTDTTTDLTGVTRVI